MFWGERKKSKKCAGTYPVKSYVKEDGTKVSGYQRTCGAKHAGKGIGAAVEHVQDDADRNNLLYKIFAGSSIKTTDDITHNGRYADLQESIAKEIKHTFFNCIKYYKLSLDFDNIKERDKENAYIKLKNIKDLSLKNFIINGSDISNLNDNTDVVIPKPESSLTKKVMNSQEFNNAIQENKDAIKRGDFRNKALRIGFSSSRDLRLTLGHVTLYDLHYENGVLCGTVFDSYNFEKKHMELSKELSKISNPIDMLRFMKDNMVITINNNVVKQQQQGKLRNYIIIFPISELGGKYK